MILKKHNDIFGKIFGHFWLLDLILDETEGVQCGKFIKEQCANLKLLGNFKEKQCHNLQLMGKTKKGTVSLFQITL